MNAHQPTATLPPTATCSSCGGEARLDHLMPDQKRPTDHLVYRCRACGALTVIDRPRTPAGLREAI